MAAPATLPERFGRYRILKKIGAGGMGTVYLGEDTVLGRKVAVKVPHFDEDDGPQVVERFQREARTAAGIDHPNLCQVFDVGVVDGVHYFTMPFIEGQPLSRLVGAESPWPARRAADLIRQLALALAVLHGKGIIHRDLKPGNVMVRGSGEPVLMDFGLARSYGTESKRLTLTGAALGTPAYMSPEQVSAQPDLGPAADIYSLGVILYELLTGRPPFEGPPLSVFAQVLNSTPRPPIQLRPDLDSSLDAICRRAMAKDPGDRPPTMQTLAADLAQYLQGIPVVRAADPEPAASSGSAPRPAGDTNPTPASGAADLRVSCPQCNRGLRVRPTMAGKRAKCPRCKTSFTLPAPPPPVVETLPVGAVATVPNTNMTEPERAPTGFGLFRDRRILVGLGVGGGVLLLLLVVLLVVGGSGGTVDKKPDDKGGPPPPQTELEIDRPEELALEIGVPTPLPVKVRRKNCKGPIELKVIGLPPGVKAGGGGFISADQDSGRLELVAGDEAEMTPQEFKLEAIASDARAETTVRVVPQRSNLPKTFENTNKMRFVLIPNGRFRMGSPEDQLHRDPDEDLHDVELPRVFYMGVHEVTQEQYQKIMTMTPSHHSATGEGKAKVLGLDTRNHPVEMISYEDALKFCEILSNEPGERAEGRVYRLPTEAEWEYCARGKKQPHTVFGFGDTLNSTQANFDGTFPYGDTPRGANLDRTTSVGSYMPNEFGLHDMHGNVGEWCFDRYGPYPAGPVKDPQGPQAGQSHVLRGGSCVETGQSCRSANRYHATPATRDKRYGFRVVCTITSKK